MEKGLFVNRVILIADEEEPEESTEELIPQESQTKKQQETRETEFFRCEGGKAGQDAESFL